MKKIMLSALVLALTSGAAMADRFHGGGRGGGGGGRAAVVVRDHRGMEVEHRGDNGWRGNVVVQPRGGYEHERHERYEHGGYDAGYNRGYYNSEPRYYHNRGVVRSNIWLERPVIRTHYYDYEYRPRLVVEDYGAREGYIFVRGEWQWDGYEWIWQPGHYEPDPAYVDVY
jgi:hypothetical protein